mgnify:CR=1 FL=1
MLRNLDNSSIRSRYPVFQNPENIILVLCGSLKIREAISLIREHFDVRSGGSELKSPSFQAIPPRKQAIRETWKDMDTDLNSIIYGFRTPGLVSEDYPAFMVIQDFLSDPRNSRLDRILNQDNHLNIHIAREMTHQFEANALILRISAPSRLAIEKAGDLVDQLLNSLADGNLTHNDLRASRTLLEMEMRKSKLDPEKRALWEAQQFHLFGSKGLSRSMEEELNAVTIQDLQQVCRKYLSQKNRVILNAFKK